jgi:hypothetical protein
MFCLLFWAPLWAVTEEGENLARKLAHRPRFLEAATTPGGRISNPDFFDSLYTHAWFVTFGLSFVIHLLLMKRR